MRRWLVLILTALGGQIRALSDGWQVSSVVMQEEIDVVVSDDRMPMQSGLDALRHIRAAGIGVPFLLITAFGADDVRAAAAKLGAEVVDMPFAATDLLYRVQRMCGLPD